ncbi:MAG: cytidine deaminase [Candidatus Hodarchaeota archaeon]
MTAIDISNEDINNLLQQALEVRNRAFSLSDPPIRVGAALLGKSGKVYLGCNIENDVTNLGICAERVAVFNAISNGEQELVAIAVISDQDIPFPPCGACRQVLWQFVKGKSDDLVVIIGNKDGSHDKCHIKQLNELLPLPFGLD